MKRKNLLLSIIVFSMLFNGIILESRAQTYALASSTGADIQFDASYMGIKIRMTVTITSISPYPYGWSIQWSITGGPGTGGSYTQQLYSDPTADPDGLDVSSDNDFMVPTPVPQYLTAMAAALGSEWASNGNTLYYDDGSGNTWEISYDESTGLLTHFVAKSAGMTTMELTVVNNWIGVIIAIVVILIIVVVVIVTVLLVKKNRKSKGKKDSTYTPTIQTPGEPGLGAPSYRPPAYQSSQSSQATIQAPVATPLFCPNCGLKQDPNATFCGNCGEKL